MIVKNSSPPDRIVARTGKVAVPKGRESSHVTHKTLGNDHKLPNKPMKRGL